MYQRARHSGEALKTVAITSFSVVVQEVLLPQQTRQNDPESMQEREGIKSEAMWLSMKRKGIVESERPRGCL